MRRAMLSLGFILLVLVSSAAGGGLRGARAKPVARSVDCSRSPHEPAAMRGITAAHNAIRGRALAAGGAPLARLEWSCELGNVAQAYADDLAAEGCSLVHSGNRFGENLYWASGFEPTPARVVSGWASEAACTQAVTLEHAACAPVENLCSVCGHYTQIVWRSTRRVGCGAASCGEERVWVCNYDPPGNVYPR